VFIRHFIFIIISSNLKATLHDDDDDMMISAITSANGVF